MEAKAKLNNLRIAPRKVRLVADLVRGKKAKEAQVILNFAVKRASLPVLKLLNSAINSAKNNYQQEIENLYISKITVDEGQKYKRWMPRARGSAYEIQKKTSHITLVLKEIEEGKKAKKKAKQKIEKEVIKPVEEAPVKEKKKEWKEEIKQEIQKPKVNKGRGIRRFFQRKTG